MSEENQGTDPKDEQTASGQEDQGIRWGRTITSLIVIIAVGGIMALIYRGKKDSDSEKTTSNPPPQVEVQATEMTPPPVTQTENQVPAPAAEQIIVPPVTEANRIDDIPAWVEKKQLGFGFSYTISSTWEEKIEDNKIIVYNPLNQEILGTVEILESPGITMDTLYKQLAGSPEISNIQTISKNGRTFLHYNIQNSNGFGYATISNNKVYYIVDYSHGSRIYEYFKTL